MTRLTALSGISGPSGFHFTVDKNWFFIEKPERNQVSSSEETRVWKSRWVDIKNNFSISSSRFQCRNGIDDF